MNDDRGKRLFLFVTAILLWTCLATSTQAGIMAGVLTVKDGEASVRSPKSRGPQPVNSAMRLSVGDFVTLRSGKGTITFFDNGRASIDPGVSYRVSTFGLERVVGATTLLAHQFRETLNRRSLMKDFSLQPRTVGTIVPISETKVRRSGEAVWQILTTPSTMLVNDQVWTGPKGAARLVANDGSVFQLRDGTRAYVLSDGVELEAGGCLVHAGKNNARVRTPSVVVLASRALFEVAQGQGAQVRSFQGRVATRNRSGKGRRSRSVKLNSGQLVEITATGSMSRPARFTSGRDAQQLASVIAKQMISPAASGTPAPAIQAPVLQAISAPSRRSPVPVMAAARPVPSRAVPVSLPRALPPVAPVSPAAAYAQASATKIDLPSPSDFFETSTPYHQRIGFADSLRPPPVIVPTEEDLKTVERILAEAPAPVAVPQAAPVQRTMAPATPSWRQDRQSVSAGAAPRPVATPVTRKSNTERRWAQAPQDTAWPAGLPRPGVTVTGKNVVSF